MYLPYGKRRTHRTVSTIPTHRTANTVPTVQYVPYLPYGKRHTRPTTLHLFVTRLPVQLWLISCAITNARDLSPDCRRAYHTGWNGTSQNKRQKQTKKTVFGDATSGSHEKWLISMFEHIKNKCKSYWIDFFPRTSFNFPTKVPAYGWRLERGDTGTVLGRSRRPEIGSAGTVLV